MATKKKTKGRTSKNRFNAHTEHKPTDETDKAISFINSQNLGWKADVCKLQKHHADYGSHCDKKNAQSLAQTESDLEENKKGKEFGAKGGKDFESALAKAQNWSKKYKTADEIPDNLIPE